MTRHARQQSKPVFFLCSALALAAVACGGSPPAGSGASDGSGSVTCLAKATGADPWAEALRNPISWDCGSAAASQAARAAYAAGAAVEPMRAETGPTGEVELQLRVALEMRRNPGGGGSDPCDLMNCTGGGLVADR